MKRQAANIITVCRILCGIGLMMLPVFSVRFYIVYLLCGLTDMADGIIARKTNSATALGARLDSAADFVFAAAAFMKILPVMEFPGWVWGWIAGIVTIRGFNAALGLVRAKRLIFGHTVMNKITGLLLFLLPLTTSLIDVRYSAAAVCFTALTASVQEGYLIASGRISGPDAAKI